MFDELFEKLTGNRPFPWQRALYERMTGDDPSRRFPAVCDIPTGLGKTSVIAIWVLALAFHADRGEVRGFPRRLVYVVNRRTVVDQSTREAELLRHNLAHEPGLASVATRLRNLAAKASQAPLAISTLRGQFADNAEWRADPARAAVIVGTVDMIGSRLLFNGYGCGFKTKPLHAGFLGQDSLLVHDEAHLEPAFQSLVESVRVEQQRNKWERDRFHVIALSATARDQTNVFTLTDKDRADEAVQQRIHSAKTLKFHDVADGKAVLDRIVELALENRFKDSGKAILIFVRKVEDVLHIRTRLEKSNQRVVSLTGTLRGYERDRLVESPVFARFMRSAKVPVAEGTVFLVCTSAGEVGVNISADHLVCDLAPLDSMAQRFGRVHRFGHPRTHTACLEVVAAVGPAKDDFGERCRRTREILERLPLQEDGTGRSASPAALSDVLRNATDEARQAAFSPQPAILRVTDILFDAWSLTSIRETLPGRPEVEPYLHGVSEYEPPQTEVAWRLEVERLTPELRELHNPRDLLEDFPLKPHELLRDRTDRVMSALTEIAERCPSAPIWIVDAHGVVVFMLASEVAKVGDKQRQFELLAGRTVVLPPFAGGLCNGLLDGSAMFSDVEQYDVADEWKDEDGAPRRCRTEGRSPSGMRLVRTINLGASPEEDAPDPAPEASEGAGESSSDRMWNWYVQPKSADDDGSKAAREAELLTDHLNKAARHASAIATKLVASAEAQALELAAAWHDLGKSRRVWQRSIGNTSPRVLAKSGPGMSPREITPYRHEFGSLIEVTKLPEFSSLEQSQRELVLHAIGAHHGRGRPHFPPDEAFDPEHPSARASETSGAVVRRFAMLQMHYGRWGLAYLESLIRAADVLASLEIGPETRTGKAAE